MGGRKRQNLTLDLNSASPKKNKVQNLLTSPDVQMLKLTSPELEKFLSQNPSLATPTPSSYGCQHARHPQRGPVWAAGPAVSSPPPSVSSKH